MTKICFVLNSLNANWFQNIFCDSQKSFQSLKLIPIVQASRWRHVGVIHTLSERQCPNINSSDSLVRAHVCMKVADWNQWCHFLLISTTPAPELWLHLPYPRPCLPHPTLHTKPGRVDDSQRQRVLFLAGVITLPAYGCTVSTETVINDRPSWPCALYWFLVIFRRLSPHLCRRGKRYCLSTMVGWLLLSNLYMHVIIEYCQAV